MMKLLCATDLLPKSEPAIDRAGLLADGLGAELLLLHVVAPTEATNVLERILQIAITQMKARGQPPSWQFASSPDVLVRTGSPARLILQAVAQTKADLLVLGPHRSRSIRDALEGTIASKVLAAQVCPVLIAQQPPEGPYRRVMLALDDSPASAAAIRAAESLVMKTATDAMVVHSCEPPYRGILQSAGVSASSVESYATGWLREAGIRMRDVLKYHSTAFTQYEIVVEQGRPATGILQAVRAHKPDLLVMGTGSHGRLHRAFLGSVANEVLLRATCDVLIVPEGAPLNSAQQKPLVTRPRKVAGRTQPAYVER